MSEETASGARRPHLTGFWGLTVAQLLGAFNDNAWKTLLQFLAIETIADEASRDGLVSLAAALFTLPFLLFSLHAGGLADRYSKRTVLIVSKFAEIAIMALGAAAFLWGGSFGPLMAVLCLLATQSAYYGPSKYGILPEILPPWRLAWGNGIIEMTTFVGIIGGSFAGASLLGVFKPPGQPIAGSRLWELSLILTVLAVAGTAASFFIPRVPPAAPARRPNLNPFLSLIQAARPIAKSRVLYLSVAGTVYFWSLGNLATLNLFGLGRGTMQLTEQETSLLLVPLAGGIGLGSLLAGKLSGKAIELGLVPLGALGLSLFSIVLYFTPSSYPATMAALFFLGASGGFFIVPLNSLLQEESPPTEKGAVLAATQVATFAGMTLSAGLFWVLKRFLSPPEVFLACGVFTIAATAYVVRLLPEMMGRLLLWLLTHSVYRVKVVGRENLPDRGPALLVANHVSYVDGLLIVASTHRFIRFLVHSAIAELPVVRHLARFLKVIPISSELGPKAIVTAFREAEATLKAGGLVCIFPEGQITRTGQMLPFQKGFERIVRNVEVPIVPVHLDRVWGSIFSFQGGKFLWKRPKRWPYPVTVSFGKPLPSSASSFDARQAVAELGSVAYLEWKKELEPLHRAFIRSARHHRRRLALADSTGRRLTFGRALASALGLARRLRGKWEGQERVGILLPPSVPAALANVAALLADRMPVNLNYTVSADSLRSAAAQSGLRTVLTSRAFLEKVKIEVPGEPIYLEDLAAPPTAGERILLGLSAFLAPARLLERLAGRRRRSDPFEPAVVLFSSGSTGDPKGVLLTHANLLSNIRALESLFDPGAPDRMLGVLPFFHSFGLTATLWYPLAVGIGAVYHPNPLDARTIGELVREYGCTFLLATPTFLQSYTRRCDPASFGSLKYAVVGAEKLTDRVADAFEERFGLEPLEGYGCTECSPLVAVNVLDHRERGIHQVGRKRGRIGHPIPGVAVRIVDPESGEVFPPGKEGLLLVRGPNVMAGYLGRPDLTAQAIRDGWYVTGDLAVLDDEGFITVTDRISRFSKIAGEMVPHQKVEEALHQALASQDQVLAVAGLPDDEKGERLAVLHTLDGEALAKLLEKLPGLGLPNLWLPKKDAFVRVDALPVLGSGKLDLRKVRELAAAVVTGSADARSGRREADGPG